MHKRLTYFITLLVQLVLLLSLGACSHPQLQTRPGTSRDYTRLNSDSVVMSDSYVLPMKTWQSTSDPAAVVLALHGFNDYSNAFDDVAKTFAGNSITTYAIDQRGFGATEQRGIWAGHTIMQSDLVATLKLLCDKHAGLPIILLGESMGGAVILGAIQQVEKTCIQGVILSSPAVWGWQTMPWYQTVPLRMLAHMFPGNTVTGEGLDITPSDNDEMLRALGHDPLIIKETRIDAIYGLTDLMEAALVNGSALKIPALILYGEHDEIIPPKPFCRLLNNLPNSATSHWRLVLYPDGYHMLSRDLQGEVVIQDMLAWIHNQQSGLPSSHEVVQDTSRLSALRGCEKLRSSVLTH
ncbi:MAG: lysophospholipase [Gammaproteobacteria bacterium]|nr:lysophospholipase [Gammaproteobacteria bacterium]